ncbi:YraN family protein [Actinosynnema sp. NPDC020468]|uniref:YraN family protein n=1 Tax=Actinosynnema sp. NPDC020468 TaxID=3154488 RepID=UPI0033CEF1F5
MNAVLGRRGEDVACSWLEQQGLVVLSRNWRCPEGELDVIATDGATLVVCEVKSRTDTSRGDPLEAVDQPKLDRLRRATARWLCEHHVGWVPIRYDVIALEWPPEGQVRLRHVRGVM